ncbi:AGAP009205-PA-like protein [Anopheles sinensis]|uniref:AGAP009205-PA-like protein n=1 Tax=Anopheles sinensis TaxID=74873 RepID=A0A084WQN7_ANOSI|nr:AGAP009205-PA-like protein [Anopheles sinensis]
MESRRKEGGHGDCHDHSNCTPSNTEAVQSLTMNNELDRLRTLITKGHLHDRDSCGYTALHYAARSGHRDACQLLLSGGLGVDEVTNGGVTALQRAAMMGHEEIVRLLLSHKANPSLRDSDGRTALHRAAEGGHLACCQRLVEQNPALCQIEDARHQKPIDLVRDHRSNADELRRLLGC